MKKTPLIIFIFIIVVETIGILYYINRNLATLREKFLLEAQLEKTQKDLQEANFALKDSQERIISLEESNKDLLARLSAQESRSKELENQLEKLENINSSFQELKNYILKNLPSSTKILKELKEDMKDEQKKVYENILEILKEIKSIKKVKTPISSVQLGQVVVEKKTYLEGKILSVNNQYKLAVINIGKNKGIKTGEKFIVLRKGKRIATLKIKEIYPFMSLCEIEEGSGDIRSGDKIRSSF